jgi:adenine phosphoribosyltransferase
VEQNKKMNLEYIKNEVRIVNDYPHKGIIFRDLTTVFKDPTSLQFLSDLMYETYKDKGITKIIGIESRGFIMGPVLATRLNAGFVPIRKKGKLPANTIKESYMKEYGEDTIEIHKDALTKDDITLVHDDLLATGGTMQAAYNLVKKFGVKDIYMNFIIELTSLNGRQFLSKEAAEKMTSFIQY